MASQIHPTAIIEPKAQLGADVTIGAYAYVGGPAVIGDGTVIHHHGTVEGNTILGRQCEVFPYAAIGTKTHDLKFKGGNPGVRIGDRNVFREYVTVHFATKDGVFTVLGNGHVVIEEHVNIGWGTGVHQFCRVGAHAMLGAMSKVVQDVPPFLIADGNPAVIRSINKVGLERSGFTPEQIERIKQIHRILFREGLNRGQALEKLQKHPQAASEEFQRVLSFAAASERGLMPGR